MQAAFRHVTVPVDGSAPSARSVEFAIELARGGGRVTFCNVVDAALAYLPAAEGAAIDPSPILVALEAEARTLCDQAAQRAHDAGVDADAVVCTGARVPAIKDLVRANGSDAIVIGTHGRRGLARTVLGSVTEGVLRCSDVPVVTVHGDDTLHSGPVLVAIDRSVAARAALDTAIALARESGARLDILHVVDDADLARMGDYLGYDPAIASERHARRASCSTMRSTPHAGPAWTRRRCSPRGTRSKNSSRPPGAAKRARSSSARAAAADYRG